MSRYKVTIKLTHKELVEKFININTGVKVVDWQPLIADECQKYANLNQPIIRVNIDGGNWLRVYVDKKNNEITWY